MTQPIFIEVCIPASTAAGVFRGSIVVNGVASDSASSSAGTTQFSFKVPVVLEVWPIELPPLGTAGLFNAMVGWSGWVSWGGIDDPASDLHAWWPNKTREWAWETWIPFLAKRRIPPQMLYATQPQPIEFYQQVAGAGAQWINLFDVSAAIQYQHQNLTDAYVAQMLATLAPTVANATALGIIDKLYVYGFDEIDYSLNATVYKLAGAIKQRWPRLRIVAALDWPVMPSDLPVDVWVDMYSDYFCDNNYGSACAHESNTKQLQREAWEASGKEYFWYWCLQPHDPRLMNTVGESNTRACACGCVCVCVCVCWVPEAGTNYPDNASCVKCPATIAQLM